MSQRVAMVIHVLPEYRDVYLELHKNPDPNVMQALKDAHHRDYTLFILGDLLVATFTYTGHDLAVDRQKLRNTPELQDWMEKTATMQRQFSVTQEGQWWSLMEEFLHNE